MKGNILQYEQFFKNTKTALRVILSYGSDKSQLDYIFCTAKKYFESHIEHFSTISIDLNLSKTPIESIEKAILKANNFFSKNIFIHCTHLPEKYILPFLDFLKSKESLYCYIDLSHIPVLYKNLAKYDLQTTNYFVSAYPFKFTEKKNYIEHFFKLSQIKLLQNQAQLLSDILEDDFRLMHHQLKSIELYVYDAKIITNDDIEKFAENAGFKHIDSLFLDLLLKKRQAPSRLLDYVQTQLVDPHFIARSFLKYVKKIYYLITTDINAVPINFEGLTPYVVKLITPSLPSLKKLYTSENLGLLLHKTNILEEKLRETKKDPLQTLNQFFIEFNGSYNFLLNA
jgi:DNA polymerase III delta subunit